MDIFEKLEVLSDAAKYDASCSSSGADRGRGGSIGSAAKSGICHTWTSDGRCVSLLKILYTNYCEFDCAYCVNRKSNDVRRVAFTPRELADLTVEFYKRNYIEGLFLSSGVIKNADYTMELIIKALEILRYEYGFNGYIHSKVIPGTSPELVERVGMLADRVSVNIEMPSAQSLARVAPDKSKANILTPMKAIQQRKVQAKEEIALYRNAPKFAPAGQSTQMIVGASEESDLHILRLTQGLYDKFSLKRVYFSAYIPINNDRNLPAIDTKPPLLREHRLYQADWLLRFYHFRADELLDEQHTMFNEFLDPKCNWALNNMHLFPVEVNTAPYELLLRVPGIGVTSAKRIVSARKVAYLDFDGLKKIGVVLKRAQFFITCKGKAAPYVKIDRDHAERYLISSERQPILPNVEQVSLFDSYGVMNSFVTKEDKLKCLSGQM